MVPSTWQPTADVGRSPDQHQSDTEFFSRPLLDDGLPGRLRDIAAKLLSSIRAQQKAVTQEDLLGLSVADAEQLVLHLTRAARDRPTQQQAAMLGIIRITKQYPQLADMVTGALRTIPAAELEPGAVMLIQSGDIATFGEVVRHWHDLAPEGPIKGALSAVVGQQG